MMTDTDELLTIATRIRRTVVEMCRAPGQGYVGQGLELADAMAVVFHHALRRHDDGSLRDRFVLSTGHSAIALYATLETIGTYSLDELRTYGLDGSEIEESPLDDLPGFEVTGGSLGQGPSQAVGIAIGERIADRDTRVICEVSDGELQEGAVWEAFMLAAAMRLGSLTFVVDLNGEQADGATDDVLPIGDVVAKLSAFGLSTRTVDGHDIAALVDTFDELMWSDNPQALVCATTPGHGVSAFDHLDRVHYVRADEEVWDAAAAELDRQLRHSEVRDAG